MLKKFKNINNNEFCFNVVSKDDISTSNLGYVITPEGSIIPVLEDINHSDLFNSYLSNYLDKEVNADTFSGITMLTKYNHAVYIGIKMDGMDESYNGIGLLALPNDYKNLTYGLIDSVSSLINSNIINDKEYMELYYRLINKDNTYIEVSKEELNLIIENNKAVLKKY